MNDKHEVSKAEVTRNGNTNNTIGPVSDPNHGHVSVRPDGSVRYGRDYGESKDNPSIPDSVKNK